DPDVILIGEIRDTETLDTALKAADTGHLVLSTLHTNDAPSAITRLIEMGIEPFLVGSAVDCVLAQRLARRLCGRCKEPYQPTAEALTSAGFPFDPAQPVPTLYRANGCTVCSRTGYKGRMALQEVMIVTEEIERLAVGRATSFEVADMARQQGLVSLRNDGMAKVAAGFTSLDEVLRVVV
ncbi:MAG: ATPase, T2SS/T4P/T4SS family, partial [Candidatus Nanopelagicales bacterium]|nr:ATPase, T2SS/T4P/T4SS family [Candidatus Nanopelagicales bacterium]